ncbi:Short-chain dehydrogenase [Nymphaea thermarum]|nr:Short-chain dehydrogenase [Nymphaea thermarum]
MERLWSWVCRKRPSGFGACSTAEEVTEGIDASNITTIVTGATSGIGMETARVLALRGATVIIAARSKVRGEKAKEKIVEEVADAKIEVMELDLSSLASVRSFAAAFLSSNKPLHLLVNNAGILGCPFQLSADGIELQFATNHIASAGEDESHCSGELNRRKNCDCGAATTCYLALHPNTKGVSGKYFSDCKEDQPTAYGRDADLAKRLWEFRGGSTGDDQLPPSWSDTNKHNAGAATTCYLALHPNIKGVSGKYFSDCNEDKPTAFGRDANLGPSGFGACSTAEEVTEGIDASNITAIVTEKKVNVGHFLLTNLLLEKMKATTGESGIEGRIVIVASLGHISTCKSGIRFEKINNRSGYRPFYAYGQSKLANILHAKELGGGSTGDGQLSPSWSDTNKHNAGAATTCYLALHPNMKGVSGKYFSDCNEDKPTAFGRDADLAKKLWEFRKGNGMAMEFLQQKGGIRIWFSFYCRASYAWNRCFQHHRRATSGIGMETARVLALRGATVIIAAITQELGEEAKEKIVEQVADAKIEVMELELSSLASVRSFAAAFLSSSKPLNLLINNAGIFGCPFQLSEDGIELQFAINYIGHFLLTNLLLKKMKATAQESRIERRIVIVASTGHSITYKSGIRFENINNPSGSKGGGQLSASGSHTDKHSPGAATTCYLALHPNMEGVSGKYFSDCKEDQPTAYGRDADLAKRLWENNAGIFGCPFQLSADGIELQFATNHIGNFLLTNLLLEKMKATTEESRIEGRIVIVPSAYKSGIRFENINNPSRCTGDLKLMGIPNSPTFFMPKNLLEEGAKVTANSLHAGAIPTNIAQYYIKLALHPNPNFECVNEFQGAATTCYLALHPNVKGVSGKYFYDCKEDQPTAYGRDADLAKGLWEFRATSGLGMETARVLALRGATVIIPARSKESGEKAKQKIVEQVADAKIEVMEVDLSSLASVRSFAAAFLSSDKPLNLLINNAGIYGVPFQLSKDGIELQFATNHIGECRTFLVDKSFAGEDESHCLEKWNRRKNCDRVIGSPQNLQICHSEEGAQVTVNSLHPGVIPTNIMRFYSNTNFKCVKKIQGAATTCYLALHPNTKGVSGKYFRDCNEDKPTAFGQDANLAKKLWEFSEEMTDNLIHYLKRLKLPLRTSTNLLFITSIDILQLIYSTSLKRSSAHGNQTQNFKSLKNFQGAATTCYLALHPNMKGVSGKYFSDCNEAKPTAFGRDAALAKKLWDFRFGACSTAEEVTEGIDASNITAIVTGATSGIGMETARVLALRGATVIIPARSKESGEIAKGKIVEQVADAKIEVMELDLSSLTSVRSFAATFLSSNKPLNLLINNAGIYGVPFQLSKDGIELQFATNHIGKLTHNMLTFHVLSSTPFMIAILHISHSFFKKYHKLAYYLNSFTAKIPHKFKRLRKEGECRAFFADKSFAGEAESHSSGKWNRRKNCDRRFGSPQQNLQIWHSEEGAKVTVNSLHPGVIPTNIMRSTKYLDLPLLRHRFFPNPNFKCVKNFQGAATTCYLVLHPNMKGVSGKYFSDCNEDKPTAFGQDADLAKKLWEFSEEMISTKLPQQ